MQLRNRLKAVFASVDKIDAPELLLVVEQDRLLVVLVEGLRWQFLLELADVVLEDGLEGALQVEECASPAELQAPVQRFFDVLEQVERGTENDKVDSFEIVGTFGTDLVEVHLDLRLFLL